MIINNKEITIKKAAELTGKSPQTIRNWYKDGKIVGRKDDRNDWNIFLDLTSLTEYASCKNQVKPYGDIILDAGDAIYPLYGYDYMYATTSNGKVVNLSNGKRLFCEPDAEDGYVHLFLMKNGISEAELEHVLIAKTQCPNSKFKQLVYHIDHNLANNHPTNLLWVSQAEYEKLEYLYKNDKTAHKKEIKKVLADNMTEVYKVPHPDWSQYNTETIKYWTYYDKQGYKAYMDGKTVLSDNIICDRVEYIGGE